MEIATQGHQHSSSPHRTPSRGYSWRLGSLAGIPVAVHVTFALLLAWVMLSHFLHGHGLRMAVTGVLLVIGMFVCVVLHELSHALVARGFGIGTREITLLPIGGMARLERMPERPIQELAVALAGPVTSFAIAGVLYVAARLLGGPMGPESLALVGGPFLDKLMWINVGLAAFNLLPAFPMDGGRILRAALATRLGRVRATQIAARTGQAMAILFGVVGVYSNPLLVLIALFVWLGAKSEATVVEVKSALGGLPVAQAMVTHFQVLSPHASLARAVELALKGFQQDFPVMDRGHVVGVLTRAGLLKGLAGGGPDAPIEGVMDRAFPTVSLWDTLDIAFERLQSCECGVAVVMQDDVPVGLVTAENVGHLLTFSNASHLRQSNWQNSRSKSA